MLVSDRICHRHSMMMMMMMPSSSSRLLQLLLALLFFLSFATQKTIVDSVSIQHNLSDEELLPSSSFRSTVAEATRRPRFREEEILLRRTSLSSKATSPHQSDQNQQQNRVGRERRRRRRAAAADQETKKMVYERRTRSQREVAIMSERPDNNNRRRRADDDVGAAVQVLDIVDRSDRRIRQREVAIGTIPTMGDVFEKGELHGSRSDDNIGDAVMVGIVDGRKRQSRSPWSVHDSAAEDIWTRRGDGPSTITFPASRKSHSFYFRNDAVDNKEKGAESHRPLFFRGPNVTVTGGPEIGRTGSKGLRVSIESRAADRDEDEDGQDDDAMISMMRMHNSALDANETIKYASRPMVTNIALGRYASADASSALCGHYPQNAVDGIIDGHDRPGEYISMSGRHGQDPEPYWQVDLGRTGTLSVIKEIRVYNREDGGEDISSRIVPFWIMIFSDFEGVDEHGLAMGPPRSLRHALEHAVVAKKFETNERLYDWIIRRGDVHGRWVRVQMEKTNFLQLAEVEVYAVEPTVLCPTSHDGNKKSDVNTTSMDEVDPMCYSVYPYGDVRQDDPVFFTVNYTCLLPGVYTVQSTIEWYDPSSSYEPTTWAWRKVCSDRSHPSLRIEMKPWSKPHHRQMDEWKSRGIAFVAPHDTVNDRTDAVVIVNAQPASTHTTPIPVMAAAAHAEFAFEEPSHVVPGHVISSALDVSLDAVGATQRIRPPRLEIVFREEEDDDDDAASTFTPIASPELVGPDIDTVRHAPQTMTLKWNCHRAGLVTARITLTPVPYLQPYGMIRFGLNKRCGGPRREGFNVNVLEIARGSPWSVIRDGALAVTSQPDFSEHVFGDTQMTWAINLPVREDTVGNHSSLTFAQNYAQLNVELSCEPNVCKDRYVYDGPHVQIVANEDGVNNDENDDISDVTDGFILVSHYCTRTTPVLVRARVHVSFYDPIEWVYQVQCKRPWYTYFLPWLW